MKYLILVLIPSVSLATVKPDPQPVATAEQSQYQHQSQYSASGAEASNQNNVGNSQSLTTNYERQAPSVAQGGLYIGECGAGGNAGGSNTNGAGFLGITWTPKDCKLLLAARAYQSLGMVDSACEMLNAISVVKKRWAELGIDPPKCQVKATLPESKPLSDPPSAQAREVQAAAPAKECATEAQLERAFRTCAGK